MIYNSRINLDVKAQVEFSKIELGVGCVKDLIKHQVLVYARLKRKSNTTKIKISFFVINKN